MNKDCVVEHRKIRVFMLLLLSFETHIRQYFCDYIWNHALKKIKIKKEKQIKNQEHLCMVSYLKKKHQKALLESPNNLFFSPFRILPSFSSWFSCKQPTFKGKLESIKNLTLHCTASE